MYRRFCNLKHAMFTLSLELTVDDALGVQSGGVVGHGLLQRRYLGLHGLHAGILALDGGCLLLQQRPQGLEVHVITAAFSGPPCLEDQRAEAQDEGERDADSHRVSLSVQVGRSPCTERSVNDRESRASLERGVLSR